MMDSKGKNSPETDHEVELRLRVDNIIVVLSERFSRLVKDAKRIEAAQLMREIQVIQDWKRNGMLPHVFPIDLESYGIPPVIFPPELLTKDNLEKGEVTISVKETEDETRSIPPSPIPQENSREAEPEPIVSNEEPTFEAQEHVNQVSEETEPVRMDFENNRIDPIIPTETETLIENREETQDSETNPGILVSNESNVGAVFEMKNAAIEARQYGNLEEALALAEQALILSPNSPELRTMVNEIKREKEDVESWVIKQGGKKQKYLKIGAGITVAILLLTVAFLIINPLRPTTPAPVISSQAGRVSNTLKTPDGSKTITASMFIPTASVIAPQKPVSKYVLRPVPLPAWVLSLFMIDDSQAEWVVNKDNWTIELATTQDVSAVGSGYHIGRQFGSGSEVIFTLDIPLEADGLYEVFTSDALDECDSNGFAQHYSVGVNTPDGQFSLSQPLVGKAQAVMKPKSAQSEIEWRSLGIYRFRQGDYPEIHLKSSAQLTAKVCVDAILITQLPPLPSFSKLQQSDLRTFTSPENVVFWIDDSDPGTLFSPAQGWSLTEPESWNFSGDKTYAYSNNEKPRVTYRLSHPLPAGQYQVFAWTGEKLLGEARYEVLVNDQLQATTVVSDKEGLTTFKPIGKLTIVDAGRDNFLTVRLSANSPSGVLASDIVLVTTENP